MARSSDTSRDELKSIVNRLLDGGISLLEQERLDAMLCASSEAREEYISLLEVHDRLQSQSVPWLPIRRPREEAEPSPVERSLIAEYRTHVSAILAVVLLIGLGLQMAPLTFSHKKVVSRTGANHDEAVAAGVVEHIAEVVSESDGCRFFIEGSGRGERGRIRNGETLRLSAGRLRVDFRSGVTLTMRAPSAVTFVSAKRARALLGGMKAYVGESAHGFTISTPVADIIDLGTVFGVNIDPAGNTDVAVFAGAVDVVPTVHLDDDFNSIRLQSGEAARLNDRGSLTRVDSIADDLFPTFVKSESPPNEAIISDAYDNLDPLSREKKYRIVRGGMSEDAKSFADRIAHEWNGVTSDGMPSYLVGGDYIAMFNDDQINSDFQMTVKLKAPANLYILMDEEVVTPEWLERDFELTGHLIGLDGGPSRFGLNENWTSWAPDVGAGKSIDRRFKIWHRQVAHPGEIRLGPNLSLGAPQSERGVNMYGVVATSLDSK
jgi:ferric-dicitrate binding protein FerR (iron transport regulator)